MSSPRILADHRKYSRANLQEGIMGKEFYLREAAMERGSRNLLRALWSSHQRVMLVAKAHGRQVEQP